MADIGINRPRRERHIPPGEAVESDESRRGHPPPRPRGPDIKADPVVQERLLELQATDVHLLQLQRRRTTLPELAEAAQLKKRCDEVNDELVAAQTVVSDLQLAQERAERDLSPVRERLTREQHRIDSGSVSDPQVLADLIAETNRLVKRISDLEDAELEIMEQAETAEQVRARLSTERNEVSNELAAVVNRGRGIVSQIDADVSTYRAQRAGIVSQLPAELVALYDKIAAQHRTGVATLVQRRCQGCQLEANAADLRAYAAAPADEVLRCEECGRILIRTKESGLT